MLVCDFPRNFKILINIRPTIANNSIETREIRNAEYI